MNSKEEFSFIAESFNSDGGFWLGATDRNLDGKWQWLNGDRWPYYQSSEGMNGPFISIQDRKFKDNSANATKGSLIEWDQDQRKFLKDQLNLVWSIKNDFSGNKRKFVKFRDHYYLFVAIKMSWQGAQNFAKNHGAHLVNITSTGEREFLQKYTKGIPIWTGGQRVNKSEWKWANGERWGYNEWDPNFPRNIIEYSNIALSWKKSEYQCYPGKLKLMFVLEWDN